jgi:hypothetical protein
VETGRPASGLAQTVLPVSLTMAGEASEILFSGVAPGTVGVVRSSPGSGDDARRHYIGSAGAGGRQQADDDCYPPLG